MPSLSHTLIRSFGTQVIQQVYLFLIAQPTRFERFFLFILSQSPLPMFFSLRAKNIFLFIYFIRCHRRSVSLTASAPQTPSQAHTHTHVTHAHIGSVPFVSLLFSICIWMLFIGVNIFVKCCFAAPLWGIGGLAVKRQNTKCAANICRIHISDYVKITSREQKKWMKKCRTIKSADDGGDGGGSSSSGGSK